MTARPESTGVAVDFDGTLAEIVPDPERAVPLDGATEVLDALAARFAVTAVVSGRTVEFLVDRLRIGSSATPLQIFGEYGLERRSSDGTIVRDPEVRRYLDAVGAALREARANVPDGVHVEEKGISLTLNWRRAPEMATEAMRIAGGLAERHGLTLKLGKMAAELVPNVACDKGVVVRSLFSGLAAGCVLGDDVADIPAFEAVAELELSGEFDGVRVVADSAEVPEQLVTMSDVLVEGPRGALEFLSMLAEGAAGSP